SANEVSNDLTVAPGLGGGFFGPPISHSMGLTPRALAAGALKGASKTDFLTADFGSSTITARIGSGTLVLGVPQPFVVAPGPTALAAGGVDGGGVPAAPVR